MGQQTVKQPRRPDDQVTPDIQRVGRWFYEVRLHIQPADDSGRHWIAMTTEPPSLVLGRRWAQSKARRMLRAYEREQARR